jgi:hypothetical protein
MKSYHRYFQHVGLYLNNEHAKLIVPRNIHVVMEYVQEFNEESRIRLLEIDHPSLHFV